MPTSDRCFITYAPVRDDERFRSRIEKARARPDNASAPGFFCRRVASGEHHPIGIEVELRDLARAQEPIVKVAWLVWYRERQGRFRRALGKLLQISRKEPMGREIDDTVLVELRLLDGCLGCRQSEPDIVRLPGD
jgi:hypothetical protein